MSRFADPGATAVVPLGPCQCPGTPHEQDEAVVRWQLGSSALGRVGAAEIAAARGDVFTAWRQLVVEAVVAWNLMAEEDGQAVAAPVSLRSVAELDEDTLTSLATAIDRLVETRGVLPNASGAPSPASPRGSASRTRKPTPRHGT